MSDCKKNNNLIVTFQNELNFGAVLQAYALQRYLNKNNISTNVCNIKFNLGHEESLINTIASLPKKIKFYAFQKKQIPLTESVKNEKEFAEIIKKYKNIIVGSDQVFALDILGNHKKVFYIDFPHSGKYSYAASFGNNENILKNVEEIRRYLASFKRVSIREKSSSLLLHKEGIRSVSSVDPTLLLDSSQYVKDFGLKKKDEDYILAYIPTIDNEAIRAVNELRERTGLRVVCFNIRNRFGKNTRCLRVASPVDFLRYFYNAKYVITNSFHGTCFSIIFKKPFISVLNKGKGERQKELLALTGLSERIYVSDKDIKEYMSPLSEKLGDLDKAIVESKKYLEDITKDKKE